MNRRNFLKSMMVGVAVATPVGLLVNSILKDDIRKELRKVEEVDISIWEDNLFQDFQKDLDRAIRDVEAYTQRGKPQWIMVSEDVRKKLQLNTHRVVFT